MQAKFLTVDSVTLNRIDSTQPLLIIQAKGTVPTSGWHNAVLTPYVYLNPPADGIWDFDLSAFAPNGLVLKVTTPLETQAAALPLPAWCKGVRVHASTNSVEAEIGEARVDTADMVKVGGWTNPEALPRQNPLGHAGDGGGDFPWGWVVDAA
ncbi:MAG: hypothetical protein JWP52_2664 [Rhizobacter sp.]|nr:hypothetical protein [Rhizobacter sp.]